MRVYPDLTHDRARKVIGYDPETGIWTWRVRTGTRVRVGDRAGAISDNGKGDKKRIISIDRQSHVSGRLAWFWMTGKWPPPYIEVDHKNGNSLDDRWENLRLATRAQQLMNRKMRSQSGSGFRGVRLHKRGLWQARMRVDGEDLSLGYFKIAHEAHDAYCHAAAKEHGEFLNDSAKPFTQIRADYEALYYLQKGLCACCSKAENVAINGKREPLVADHDPVTKDITGLFCRKCLLKRHGKGDAA